MNHRLRLMMSSLLFVATYASVKADVITNKEASETRAPIVVVQSGMGQTYKIQSPGVYRLNADLEYTGNNAAIVIAAPNVALDLGGYSVKCSNPSADGIRVKKDSWNFELSNGHVINNTEFELSEISGNGVKIKNTRKGIVEGLIVHRFNLDINIDRAQDITVKDCIFNVSKTATARVQGSNDSNVLGSTNIEFDNCIFRDAPHGLLVDGFNNKDLTVKNCQFPDASQTDLLINNLSGLMVSNCSFTNKDANVSEDLYKRAMIQLGGADDNLVTGGLIKDCTIINENTDNGWIEGIRLTQAENVTIDGCVLNMVSTNDMDIFPCAIHLGSSDLETNAYGCVVRNCHIDGGILTGIYLDGSCSEDYQGNVIEDCKIDYAARYGIYMYHANSNTIRNNVIQNTGYDGEWGSGVYVDDNCSYNLLNDNTSASNNGHGFTARGEYNIFQHNQAFNNNCKGFDNDECWRNVFLFNISSNNEINYVDVSPVASRGDTTYYTGVNISGIEWD